MKNSAADDERHDEQQADGGRRRDSRSKGSCLATLRSIGRARRAPDGPRPARPGRVGAASQQANVVAADLLELPGAPLGGVLRLPLSITTFCTVCASTERPCTMPASGLTPCSSSLAVLTRSWGASLEVGHRPSALRLVERMLLQRRRVGHVLVGRRDVRHQRVAVLAPASPCWSAGRRAPAFTSSMNGLFGARNEPALEVVPVPAPAGARMARVVEGLRCREHRLRLLRRAAERAAPVEAHRRAAGDVRVDHLQEAELDRALRHVGLQRLDEVERFDRLGLSKATSNLFAASNMRPPADAAAPRSGSRCRGCGRAPWRSPPCPASSRVIVFAALAKIVPVPGVGIA